MFLKSSYTPVLPHICVLPGIGGSYTFFFRLFLGRTKGKLISPSQIRAINGSIVNFTDSAGMPSVKKMADQRLLTAHIGAGVHRCAGR